MWVIAGSFSSITVRTNSSPGIDPCSEFFSLPVLRDDFNTFPASSSHRTSIVTSGKVIGSASSPFSAVTLDGVDGSGVGVPLTLLKMWVITSSFSSITVRTNSYPGIDPCSESFSLPVLTDGFNTFPASSSHRTSIVNSGKVIGSDSSPFSAVTLDGVDGIGVGFVLSLTLLKMWAITGSFSSITVRTNSYPGIDPYSASFLLPVLRDDFNTFPASSSHRTSIVNSGKVIGSASSPFSAVTLGGVDGIGVGVPLTFLKMWVITGSFSSVTVRTNSYPKIEPCSASFSLPVLTDGFNPFPASSIH